MSATNPRNLFSVFAMIGGTYFGWAHGEWVSVNCEWRGTRAYATPIRLSAARAILREYAAQYPYSCAFLVPRG